MLFFPNCKINLGLYVIEKRGDGYHNIETVFYPIGWCDALEILENKTPEAEKLNWHSYQDESLLPPENNLVYKAWNLVNRIHNLPPLNLHFLKKIPSGAGLGGGSSDAAFTILLLNRKFDLGMNENQMMELASELGSDCAFFIKNRPQHASGRGNVLIDCHLDLSAYYILLVNPGLHSDTGAAYSRIQPIAGRESLKTIVENHPPETWKGMLVNDFEVVVGSVFPEINSLVSRMYEEGALYSAMSGSGSTVFGIFKERPDPTIFGKYSHFLQEAGMPVS